MAPSPEEATDRVKGLALSLGANLVGIAEINSLWVYSTRGHIKDDNWDRWGSAIDLSHTFAITFAIEM
jgi:hypothetical protein